MSGWDPVTGAALIAHQTRVARVAAERLAEAAAAPLLPDPRQWHGLAADAFRDRAGELRAELRRAQAAAEAAATTGRVALAAVAT